MAFLEYSAYRAHGHSKKPLKKENRRVFAKGGIEQTPFPLPSQLKAVAESGPGQAWLGLLSRLAKIFRGWAVDNFDVS
jgi:hypothetical protein